MALHLKLLCYLHGTGLLPICACLLLATCECEAIAVASRVEHLVDLPLGHLLHHAADVAVAAADDDDAASKQVESGKQWLIEVAAAPVGQQQALLPHQHSGIGHLAL